MHCSYHDHNYDRKIIHLINTISHLERWEEEFLICCITCFRPTKDLENKDEIIQYFEGLKQRYSDFESELNDCMKYFQMI